MKENDKIYLNKVNTSMKTNEFFSDLNATQLRNLILEFIGYDIKESMVEFIENDEREMQAIREEQTEVLKNLTIVEGEIFKVESAKQDAYLASTPQIKTLEETLRRELINLKAQYTALSEKLKKFASKPSDSGVEVGQDVRLTESGARATVSSIDSNTKTVKVVTSEGATLEIEHGKYEALEEEKEVAANKNDNKSETEGDKVDAEKRPEELEVDEKLSIKQKTLPQGLQDAILKKQGEKPEKEEKVEETHAIAGGNDEMPVENPNKDDFPQQEPEGESTEAPEEAPEEESEYVKAKVDDEQGGSCAGQEVEILATDYTTKGDEDLIQVKCGDEIFFIEKKFLEISTTEIVGCNR
jgi:preprotein translocase subunit YajC